MDDSRAATRCAQLEHHHVRLSAGDLGQGEVRVRFGHDLEVVLRIDHSTQARANERVIISEQNFDFRHRGLGA